MSYLEFDKTQLINLEYSLKKEMIRSNRGGCYSSTTIINCNTRKYHGLLICPVREIDGEKHVLLSSVDETVIQRNSEFNLGIHKYPGVYEPRGHKYIYDFEAEPNLKLTYRVGGVYLAKEMIFERNSERVLIKYTLLDAHSPTRLRLKPFLAFRNIHKLSKANFFVNPKFDEVPNGIKTKMYDGYPDLYMQLSKKGKYIPNPDWYYNIEYMKEEQRGYDFREDLFVHGYFEFPIKKGESVIFSAGLKQVSPRQLKKLYTEEVDTRIARKDYVSCLVNAAGQFIVEYDGKTDVIAGYPWFGVWGRDTFISLPGLTLSVGDIETCKDVLDTNVMKMENGLFPNIEGANSAAFNSVDAPMWFIWALQQYAYKTDIKSVWKDYGQYVKNILSTYKNGTEFNIRMLDNGLIYAGDEGVALTWMDAVVDGVPVTPRTGCPVEINALWYNALIFSLEAARENGDDEFVEEWKELPSLVQDSFRKLFWSDERGYLADFVTEDSADWSVRPNMVIATSIPYSPATEEMKKQVLDKVKSELLTDRGLRTLSPNDPRYKGIYYGTQKVRDAAYHQGTVWPWLLGHFAEGWLRIYRKSGCSFIDRLFHNFEPHLREHGIGTISEVFDGDPPHNPGGCISQAWSVAELLRIHEMMVKCKNQN